MKEKPTVGSPFSGRFLLTASLSRRRMSMYVSLLRVILQQALQQRFPVNYTSDLRECFETTVYANGYAREQRDMQKDGEDEVNRRILWVCERT